MLSPASLRVCCLAVMAPALTKADRRADCLPVAISEPFCDLKTATPYNRKDKYIEVNLPKLSSKFACLLNNRRKAYIHKTWFRTQLKNNSPGCCFRAPCPPSDLQNGELNAESNREAWHGTSVTLAAADKVRLKYTMNKSSSQKNMGLARTNALHSMKKVNRITQFAPRDKSNSSTSEVGESSPDLPHSTHSILETGTLTDIIQTCIEVKTSEDVSSSSGGSEICTVSEQLSNSEGDVTFPVACTLSQQLSNSEGNTIACTVADKCSIMTLSKGINVPLISEDINLNMPVTLTDPECGVIDSSIETAASLSDPADGQLNSQSFIEKSCIVPLLHHTTYIDSSSESPVSLEVNQNASNNFNMLSNSSLSKFEIASSQTSYSNPCFENLIFDPNDCVSDSLLFEPELTKLQSTLPNAQLTLSREAVKSKMCRKKVPKKKDYCRCPVNCKALLDENFNDSLEKILAAVEKSELLVRICINAYSKREISELVETYQNKLGIPCQAQSNSSLVSKELSDRKTELLQNEEVKSMSTAALVNLVRKLESSDSLGNLLSNQTLLSSSGGDASSSDVVQAFSPEDVADVMRTSSELLSSIKRELKSVDPDLTESSDSECEVEPESDSDHKMALWKFMKERAALTCRSTWLIARIHELENQLRTASSALQKITSSQGDISFEEELTTSKSAFSAISSNTSSDTPSKKVKSLSGPVNGYLDCSHKSNIAHIGLKTCSVETSLNEDHPDSSCEQCSRTKALNVSAFQKRDILVTSGLHLKSNKLAKLSTMGCHCSCNDVVLPCVLCMGRYHCVQSIDPYTMPLLDRVSLLDSNFHPLLSYQKDVPLILHFESILKKNESQYQIERPESPTPSISNLEDETKPETFSVSRSRSQKFNRYLSAKYRNKHVRNTKHLRKHGLVFGKWRRYQTKRSYQSRDRFRRVSIDSSGSSHDSPIPSPSSIYDESYDSVKKRRDENQFDIDDVIIPYSNKSARLVDFEFKDIIVPSFRIEGSEIQNLLSTLDSPSTKDFFLAEEGTHEEAYLTRHNPLEVDEKKINRRPSTLNIQPNPKRLRREHRLDSRADSSGANTPDPIIFSDQDMFQDQNSMTMPTPPALSPPPTPSSILPLSDDSLPSLGNNVMSRLERRKVPAQKRPSEENASTRIEVEEIAPYELRSFPLTDEQFEEITFDPYGEDIELTVSGPSSPASPGSTTMSTSTIEDIADPEWMVLRNNVAQEPGLKLKLAKR